MFRRFLQSTVLITAAAVLAAPHAATGDAFSDYALVESFNLPAASEFDVLADGRLVTLVGAEVYTESAVGSRSFSNLGTLADADIGAFGPAFLRVSPDGTRIAVGNNGGVTYGNYQVGVFDVSDLSGDWFPASHWDGEWIDDTNLAVTAGEFGQPAVVTALDTSSDPSSPANPTLIESIGGASAGVTFDLLGHLYTGNGYAGAGPSETGWIKAFPEESWAAALAGGSPLDFEAQGTLIVDLLSASALGFDAEGNLHVGGGDFSAADTDYAGLVRAGAVADALGGGGPVDPLDPAQVRLLDPDTIGSNFYDVNYNDVTGELYVREGGLVYTYVVPEPTSLLLLAAGGLVALGRKR